jgi:Spy/CpxP family protein refolding chaperone
MIDCGYIRILAQRTLLLALLPIAFGSVLIAQPDGGGGAPPMGPPPGEMQPQQARGGSVESELKRLNQLLTLTPEQQTQVKAILTGRNQQIDALFKQFMPQAQNGKTPSDSASSDSQPSQEAMEDARATMKTIRSDAQTKIVAVLTDEQKTKYAAWQKKHAKALAQQEDGEMQPPPPDGDGGPPPGGPGGEGGGGPQGGGGGGPQGGGPPGV